MTSKIIEADVYEYSTFKCKNCSEEIYRCFKCTHYFSKKDEIYCEEYPSGLTIHYCELCGKERKLELEKEATKKS